MAFQGQEDLGGHHGREVIVYEGHGVNELHGTSRRECLFNRPPDKLAGGQAQRRPDSLASSEKRIPAGTISGLPGCMCLLSHCKKKSLAVSQTEIYEGQHSLYSKFLLCKTPNSGKDQPKVFSSILRTITST